jgi:hypothetical protein
MTPPPPTATATPIPLSSPVEYTIRSGDSCYAIASYFGITINSLATANGLDPVNCPITAGGKLIIPGVKLDVVASPGIRDTLNYTIPPDIEDYSNKVKAQAFLRAISDPNGAYKDAWWFKNDGKLTADEALSIVLLAEGSTSLKVQQAIAARYLNYCGGDHDSCNDEALLNVFSYYQPVLRHSEYAIITDTGGEGYVPYAGQILNQTALGLDWAQTYTHHPNGIGESQWDNIPYYYANVNISWDKCLRAKLGRGPDNESTNLWILTPNEAGSLGDRYSTENLTHEMITCP